MTLKTKPFLLLAVLLPAVLLAACGGGSGGNKHPSASTDATYQAAVDEAKQTPVSDAMHAYAKQLCKPLAKFLGAAAQVEAEMTSEPTPKGTVSLDDALTQGFGSFGKFRAPFGEFLAAMRKIDPPEELKSYHEEFINEMDYVLKAIDAIEKDGFAGALGLPTPEATPQDLEGFDAGLIQECGEDLKPLMDQLGDGFFGQGLFGSSDSTPAPKSGATGETITSGNYALTVHSVDTEYETNDEFFQPTPGDRYVVVELSLKNASGESQDYTSFDFKLKDSDNFEYDSTYVGDDHELDGGSLNPGETIRGTVAFELPVDTAASLFSFQPGFFGEGRIDIKLH